MKSNVACIAWGLYVVPYCITVDSLLSVHLNPLIYSIEWSINKNNTVISSYYIMIYFVEKWKVPADFCFRNIFGIFHLVARLTRFEGRDHKKFPKGPPFAYVFWKIFKNKWPKRGVLALSPPLVMAPASPPPLNAPVLSLQKFTILSIEFLHYRNSTFICMEFLSFSWCSPTSFSWKPLAGGDPVRATLSCGSGIICTGPESDDTTSRLSTGTIRTVISFHATTPRPAVFFFVWYSTSVMCHDLSPSHQTSFMNKVILFVRF